MRQVADPIGPADVPAEWRGARYVLLACMAGEIDPALSDCFPQAKILLTAQGYFRAWDAEGVVQPTAWYDEKMLRAVDVVVFSEEDVRDLPGWLPKSQPARVIWSSRVGGMVVRSIKRAARFHMIRFTAASMN